MHAFVGAVELLLLLAIAPALFAEAAQNATTVVDGSTTGTTLPPTTPDPLNGTTTAAASTIAATTAASTTASTTGTANLRVFPEISCVEGASAALTSTYAASTLATTTVASTVAATAGPAQTTTYEATTTATTTAAASSTSTYAVATTTASADGPSATAALSSSTTQSTSTTAASLSSSVSSTTSVSASNVVTTTVSTELTSAALTASSYSASTAGKVAPPTDVATSAIGSVGFTTFSALTGSGSATTSPSLPLTACPVSNPYRCCKSLPPVPDSYCAFTGYNFDMDLIAVNLAVTVTEPFSVLGSMLLTGTVIQISSPTIIHGNFTLDANSVLSVTQVPGLNRPILTIAGYASFLGTVAFTTTLNEELLAPMVHVDEDVEISGNVVYALGDRYSSAIPLLTAARVLAKDSDSDSTTFACRLSLQRRPPRNSYKRADPPVTLLLFNASQVLDVPVSSVPISIDTKYSKKTTTRSIGTSFTILVSSQDSCGKKKISNAAIGGIVAGGVVGIAGIAVLGIFAVKKGYARKLFRSEERKSTYVI